MAGWASIEYAEHGGVYNGAKIETVTWKLTGSIAGGSCDADSTKYLVGELKNLSVHPSKTSKPDEGFNFYLYDADESIMNTGFASFDLLASAGENMHCATSEILTFSNPPCINGKVKLIARGLGNLQKKVTIKGYLK